MTVQNETQQEPRLGVDVIGFGVGEFAYLLNVFEGTARDRSVSVFRAQDMVDDVTLSTAGASSLLARDLATIDDDGDLGVTGVAAAVATALGQATRWTEVSLLTGDTMDNVVLIEAPGVALMLQPRLLGTWFVFAQDPAISSAEATLRSSASMSSRIPAVPPTSFSRPSTPTATCWSAAKATPGQPASRTSPPTRSRRRKA